MTPVQYTKRCSCVRGYITAQSPPTANDSRFCSHAYSKIKDFGPKYSHSGSVTSASVPNTLMCELAYSANLV